MVSKGGQDGEIGVKGLVARLVELNQAVLLKDSLVEIAKRSEGLGKMA